MQQQHKINSSTQCKQFQQTFSRLGMPNNRRLTKLARMLSVASLSGALASCSLSPAPLDPIIGDTGRPLSALAKQSDVLAYKLDLEVFPKQQLIAGVGSTEFLLLQDSTQLELKLDSRFTISQITVDGAASQYQRQGGVLIIELGASKAAGSQVTVAVHYSGKPHAAKNAPWAGGFVWSKTTDGAPWIATAVQGEGCDLFWPCKDHFSDKADQMRLRITVPKGLAAVSNGVLQQVSTVAAEKQQYDWLLSVPASDYNIALNIGPYQRIQQQWQGINGEPIAVEFWALPEHAKQAEQLLTEDIKAQWQFFERQLGPYPWGKQKLGFVETPHLGMEHQTINAYGKGFKRDEYGFDWLAQHELSHEWFGNLLTHQQLNDAWLHEGFGLYMQPLYALDKLGSAAYQYQMYKSYLGLLNCQPVVRSGVVSSDDAFNPDIYGKGGWILHTLRGLIGDQLFWNISRELLYGTVESQQLPYPIAPRYRSTEDFIQIVNRQTGRDYRWLFEVYLTQAALPEIVESRNADGVLLSWKTPADLPFPLPLEVSVNGELRALDFSHGPVQLPLTANDKLLIDPQMKVLRQLPLIGECQENQLKVKNKRKD